MTINKYIVILYKTEFKINRMKNFLVNNKSLHFNPVFCLDLY